MKDISNVLSFCFKVRYVGCEGIYTTQKEDGNGSLSKRIRVAGTWTIHANTDSWNHFRWRRWSRKTICPAIQPHTFFVIWFCSSCLSLLSAEAIYLDCARELHFKNVQYGPHITHSSISTQGIPPPYTPPQLHTQYLHTKPPTSNIPLLHPHLHLSFWYWRPFKDRRYRNTCMALHYVRTIPFPQHIPRSPLRILWQRETM